MVTGTRLAKEAHVPTEEMKYARGNPEEVARKKQEEEEAKRREEEEVLQAKKRHM
ncbi:MAG: hypothetical protein ACYDH5_10660 [Acidimicrobiales bacterium]